MIPHPCPPQRKSRLSALSLESLHTQHNLAIFKLPTLQVYGNKRNNVIEFTVSYEHRKFGACMILRLLLLILLKRGPENKLVSLKYLLKLE